MLQNLSIIPSFSSAASVSSSYSSRDVGYSTPEEVAEAFIAAVKSGDMNAAVSLFDCGHMTDNLDSTAYIERIRVWNPGYAAMAFPSNGGIYSGGKYESLRGQAAGRIMNFCFSLNADEEFLQGQPISDDDGNLAYDIDRFTDMEDIDTLNIVRMDYSRPDIQNSENNREAMGILCNIYGCEDIADYGVLYEYNGETYIGGMTLYKYDGKWYIDTLYSGFSGISSFCYLIKGDMEEYIETVQ